MSRYEPLGPGCEVRGASMLAFVKSAREENIQTILERHGLDNIDPDRWYPLETWLDVFNDIAEAGSMEAVFNLVGIGISTIDTAVLPPDFDILPFNEVIMRTDEVYSLNTRGENRGEYSCELVGDRHIRMIITAPYPDDYHYGIIYGLARRFLPRGTGFTVYYDLYEPRREQGGEATIIHLEWEE